MACRERVLPALLRALGTDGAARRPGLTFPPSPALLAHASLRGCLPPHSPLPHRRPPLLPAPLPADSLARTSLGLPLADWLKPSGPGDVISETWQPRKSAPRRGGEGRGGGRCWRRAEDGGAGSCRDSAGGRERGRSPRGGLSAEAGRGGGGRTFAAGPAFRAPFAGFRLPAGLRPSLEGQSRSQGASAEKASLQLPSSLTLLALLFSFLVAYCSL